MKKGKISVTKESSEFMVADVLTKSLPRVKHHSWNKKLLFYSATCLKLQILFPDNPTYYPTKPSALDILQTKSFYSLSRLISLPILSLNNNPVLFK